MYLAPVGLNVAESWPPQSQSNVPDTDIERNCHLCQQRKFCKHNLAMKCSQKRNVAANTEERETKKTSAVLICDAILRP